MLRLIQQGCISEQFCLQNVELSLILTSGNVDLKAATIICEPKCVHFMLE